MDVASKLREIGKTSRPATKYRLLTKLKKENLEEFRYQIVHALQQVASDIDTDGFIDIITTFKKEIIYEAYFYIDFINEAILKIYEEDRVNVIFILDQLIFICKLGDANTLELMQRIVSETPKKEKYKHSLEKAKNELERRIDALEKKIEGITLKPVEKKFNHWLD
jgi:hypothetical protein